MTRVVLLVGLLAACGEPQAPAPEVRLAVARSPAPRHEVRLAVARSPAPPPPMVLGGVLHFLDRQGDVQLRHGEIGGVGVSNNGRFAASGSNQGTAAAWDVTSGQLLAWIETPHVNVWAVAISDDGTRLATSG